MSNEINWPTSPGLWMAKFRTTGSWVPVPFGVIEGTTEIAAFIPGQNGCSRQGDKSFPGESFRPPTDKEMAQAAVFLAYIKDLNGKRN